MYGCMYVCMYVWMYVYMLAKAQIKTTRVTKVLTVVYYHTQAFFCIVLIFYATLGGPSWFIPLVRYKAFKGFSFQLFVYYFR